ncbi:MAG: S24/S26 family peptidase [Actinomycetota bacterium]
MIRLPVRATLFLRELLAWAGGGRERRRIEGPSMAPTLLDGDTVLVDPARRPRPGDLVAARPEPLGGLAVVKRVAHLAPDGAADLTSDNPAAGTDSRSWGPVPADRLDGVVTVELGRRLVLVADDRQPPSGLGWLRR